MAGLQELLEQEAALRESGVIREGGSPINWYPRKGDRIFFHFLWSGAPGDPFFEQFMAHEWPGSKPGQFATYVPCPVETQWDVNFDCRGCKEEVKTKPRMAMWLYVGNILHQTLRDGEQFPAVALLGQQYYNREVNDFKYWETSAWRESPKQDIFTAAQLNVIHYQQYWIQVDGEMRDRRFRLNAWPGSAGLSPEILARAKAELTSIKQMVMDKAKGVETVAAPSAISTEAPPAFLPGGAPPAAPAAPAPPAPPAFAPGPPAAAPAPFEPTAAPVAQQPAVVQEPPFELEPDAAPPAPPKVAAPAAVASKGLF